MVNISRRTVINGSLGAVGATLARPYIAKAEAKTAVVWQNQGFVKQEDEAFIKTVRDYEKTSGNKIDLSVMPFMALGQKTISALTSGDVPDLLFYDAPSYILPQNAWDDKLVDVSDVVEPYKAKMTESARLNSTFYNRVTRQRSFYLVPIKQGATPFHFWNVMVEKAGFKMSDIPNTWNGVWEFFKPVQNELRKQGMRKIYACGLQITTVGPNDGNNLFSHFMIANGGKDIVTPDGRLHTDDPKVREAAIKSVEFMTNLYKDGFVPLEALSWNDADDNNGYHEKLFVMDFDGTLSPELAWLSHEKEYYQEMRVLGLPMMNDGKTQMPCQVGAGGGFIPKGAKNIEVAKDFMRFFIQPQVINENLKSGLGRWVPPMPQIVKDDPWWLDDSKDPHRKPYVTEGVLKPTMAAYYGFNPAWGLVSSEQLWGHAHADVIKNGMKPSEAVDKAFKRAEAIFAKVSFD
ncbi:MAG TPA: ABC transporter substrate-binding protein [Acetobacteraceae bacterium]|jgi:multiple sugar transport system substrate-binding protein|nr:ABC transporter substrate-binding protein [Acetobacteraceae bacterium]